MASNDPLDNPYEAPSAEASSLAEAGPYRSYLDVPWYRKSGIMSLFVLMGLCCGPSILFVCVVVLTGDVYYDKVDETGRLKRWGRANKVAAVILLILNVLGTIYQITSIVRQGV